MTIYEHVTISHDLVQCIQTSNNLNNAPEHFSVHVTSLRLTTGHLVLSSCRLHTTLRHPYAVKCGGIIVLHRRRFKTIQRLG